MAAQGGLVRITNKNAALMNGIKSGFMLGVGSSSKALSAFTAGAGNPNVGNVLGMGDVDMKNSLSDPMHGAATLNPEQQTANFKHATRASKRI